MKICSIENCGRKHASRGWCEIHYSRWKRTGTVKLAVYIDSHPIAGEKWKDIPGYINHEASNQGRIRHKISGHISNPRPSKRGYVRLDIRIGSGKKITPSVQELVMLAFAGPRPDGYEIDHVNFNKQDNRLANLEYVTPDENKRRWREAFPEKVGQGCRRTLTENQAKQAKQLRKENLPLKAIAQILGVKESVSNSAIYGKTWEHIQV